MSKDQPAPTADEPAVDPKVEEAPAELSQVEQDALMAASEGIDGTLTPNSPEEEIDEEAPEEAPTEEPENEPENKDDEIEPETDGEPKDTPGEGEPTDTPGQTVLQKDEPEQTPQVDDPVDDPGEFKPGDYSFEVKTTDGKTHKITSPEEAYELAKTFDENPELASASQFMALASKTALMERGLAEDESKYKAQKEQYDQAQEAIKTRNETIQRWDKELKYLEGAGQIPKLDPKLDTPEAGTKWATEFRNEPGVKERMDILDWVQKENTKRIEAGLEPMTSILDAHTAMRLEQTLQANADTVSREKEQRRARGSMVGGTAPHKPENNPSNSIVGLGGSLDDLLTEYVNQ